MSSTRSVPARTPSIARRALLVLGVAAALAPAAEAQTAPASGPSWEFLVSSGTVLPTGSRGDVVQRGRLTAAQLSYVARPALAFTATLGWARSRDIASEGDPRLDIFTYDVGAEARAPGWIAARGVTFGPFAGAGVGGRSYDYRSLDVDATHNVGAYASVGGELGTGRVSLRLEARDYVTGFKPLDGTGPVDRGNDVVLMAGLRLRTR